jgi:hypothetical protein
MNVKKVTPVLVVDRIEACLPLWKALGFAPTVEVPHGEALGFVILSGGRIEVMLQSRASLQEDVASVCAEAKEGFLYCDVESLAEVRSALRSMPGARILVDERTTFYGARELWMLDASGRVFGFAEPTKRA